MLLQPGKIYYCSYNQYHKDPNPVLLVLWSDSRYTHGINVRYLTSVRRFHIMRMIQNMRNTKIQFQPQQMYRLLRKYYYDVTETSYRKYHTGFLTGTIINEGVTTVSPLIALYNRLGALFVGNQFNYLNMRAKNDAVVKQVSYILRDSINKAFQKQGENTYKPTITQPENNSENNDTNLS